MPRGGTPKCENVPLLGQGGADSSRRLLSGWFEAVDGAEPQPSCLIPNHPRWALGPASLPRFRRGVSRRGKAK